VDFGLSGYSPSSVAQNQGISVGYCFSTKEKPMRTDEDQVATCFRLDRALHTALVAEAKRALRSLNSEMILRLRKSLEQQEAA
jgi:predicted HicB family RNase H-like nuclease